MCVVADRASPPMSMPMFVSSALLRSCCEASSYALLGRGSTGLPMVALRRLMSVSRMVV